jgi:hypothetical protein
MRDLIMHSRPTAPGNSSRRALKSSKSIHTPIVGVVGFNLFTLVAFMTAPIKWDTDNLVPLYFLVLLSQLLILIGFQLGRNKGLLRHLPSRLPLSSADRFLTPLFVIYLVTLPITYSYRMKAPLFDVAAMFNQLLEGALDPRFGYQMAIRQTSQRSVPWTIFFLVSIFTQSLFVVGFLEWRRMDAIKKGLFIIFVCIELFFSIGTGTNFPVVSMATMFLFSSMLWRDGTKAGSFRSSRTTLLALLAFGGTVAFFAYTLYRRSGDVERGLELTEFGRSTTDVNAMAFRAIPESLQPTYMNVVSYLCQGYYHTSLAFDLDFKSTWFLGNNPALISLAEGFGLDVWKDTYMFQLYQREGVDQFRYWHSAYTWFACDVSFYGVPFVLFLVAYMFGFSWATSMQGDFLSKVVFVILGNVLLFLFANNTYLASVFYSFAVLLPLWLLTRVGGLGRGSTGGRA